MQWSGRHCVTASFGNFHLDRAIGAGEVGSHTSNGAVRKGFRRRRVRQREPLTAEHHRLDQYAKHLVELRQFVEPFTAMASVAVADADAQVAPVA